MDFNATSGTGRSIAGGMKNVGMMGLGGIWTGFALAIGWALATKLVHVVEDKTKKPKAPVGDTVDVKS